MVHPNTPQMPVDQFSGMPIPVQQDMPVSQDELYAAEFQQDRIKNLISQTSPENLLEEIEWRIRGYKRNTYSRQWEKIDANVPEPSLLLVSRYISELSSVLNENTRFTNLSGTEINGLMRPIIEWLTDDLDSNAEKYGLGFQEKQTIRFTNDEGKEVEIEKEIFKHDFTERSRIGHMILRITYLVLKRAQNGMESRRIFSSLSMTDALSGGSAINKQKGFLDSFKFWK